ncbi:very-short-patch-repair endonuclease [Nocardioides zeae]|uniref:Very-short-patch-repair endonuclease n=1 Tax=Nocardioides zeae TaxID=1457234 RepID=A0ACC6IMV9_9ACTN|nr:hypothetical protein [Nocardioides zeae]MDR6173320.1 very-short-patch-repair endonuclease [Nocardioides zeae]MDR6211960.1 very-short-patch-repair endonuclease [Nocardioides zeae]
MSSPYVPRTAFPPPGTTLAAAIHPRARPLALRRPLDEDRRAELARVLEALPPSGCLTGLTGAEVRGWWSLPVPDGVPVFAAVPETAPHPERRGLVVTRHAVPPVVEAREALRVGSPGEVLLGCWDLCLLDLVVLVDGALGVGEDLAEMVATARLRRRGAPLLRQALLLADTRAESLWEVVNRVFHVAVGVDVVPQHPIALADGTTAYADLWLRGTRRLHEYDGAHHLDREQQRRDLRRGRLLVGQGYERNGYTSHDLLGRTRDLLRDIDVALGREHDPRRLRFWEAQLQHSLLTPAGRARHAERWARASQGRSGRRAERPRGHDEPLTPPYAA